MKKTASATVHMSDEKHEQLLILADMGDTTISEYINLVLDKHIQEKFALYQSLGEVFQKDEKSSSSLRPVERSQRHSGE